MPCPWLKALFPRNLSLLDYFLWWKEFTVKAGKDGDQPILRTYACIAWPLTFCLVAYQILCLYQILFEKQLLKPYRRYRACSQK